MRMAKGKLGWSAVHVYLTTVVVLMLSRMSFEIGLHKFLLRFELSEENNISLCFFG